MNKPLPPGWVWATLADVAQWGSGGTPRKSEPKYYGGHIPWAVIGDLNDSIVDSCKGSITEAGLTQSSCKLVEPGTVLIAMYGSIGKLGIAGRKMATNQAIAFAKPSIDRWYLFYYLLSQRPLLATAGKGATQRNISQTVLKAWPIPIPPVNAQQRIVEHVAELFSRLDVIESTLVSLLDKLDLYRVTILAAAFNTPDDPPDGWYVVPLEHLLIQSIGGIWGSPPGENEKDVDVIRVTEFQEHGSLATHTAARRSITKRQFLTRQLQPGDLILEKSGGGPKTPVGRIARFVGHTQDAICTNFTQLMRPDASRIDGRFLHWQLHYWYLSGSTAALNKGSGNIRNLQTKVYLKQFVVVAPRSEQSKMCYEIETAFEHIRLTERAIRTSLRKLGVLRRSILTQAFAGRLGPHDPSTEVALALPDLSSTSPPAKQTRERAKHDI